MRMCMRAGGIEDDDQPHPHKSWYSRLPSIPIQQATLDEVAGRHFPGEASSASEGEALARPILFSTWLSRSYRPVQREELRDFVAARLKVCCLLDVCELC